jgi:hypothetical protein
MPLTPSPAAIVDTAMMPDKLDLQNKSIAAVMVETYRKGPPRASFASPDRDTAFASSDSSTII